MSSTTQDDIQQQSVAQESKAVRAGTAELCRATARSTERSSCKEEVCRGCGRVTARQCAADKTYNRMQSDDRATCIENLHIHYISTIQFSIMMDTLPHQTEFLMQPGKQIMYIGTHLFLLGI